MSITIYYCGQIAQALGRDSETLEFTESPGLVELLASLGERHGEGFRRFVHDPEGRIRRSLLISINDRAIDPSPSVELAHGDRVTLLPPIAGG